MFYIITSLIGDYRLIGINNGEELLLCFKSLATRNHMQTTWTVALVFLLILLLLYLPVYCSTVKGRCLGVIKLAKERC